MNLRMTRVLGLAALTLLFSFSASAQTTFVTDCESKLGSDSVLEEDQELAHTYRMLIERYHDQLIIEEGSSECQAVADLFWNLTQAYEASDNVDKKLVTVDLREKGIESVEPLGLLDSYTKTDEYGVSSEVTLHALDLAHNNLTASDLMDIDLTKIIVLDLSHNAVSNIAFLDGTSLLALRKLYLSHNPLEELVLWRD